MMNLINAIPETMGWMMVGIVGTLCVVAAVALGKTVVDAIKSRLEEDDEVTE